MPIPKLKKSNCFKWCHLLIKRSKKPENKTIKLACSFCGSSVKMSMGRAKKPIHIGMNISKKLAAALFLKIDIYHLSVCLIVRIKSAFLSTLSK